MTRRLACLLLLFAAPSLEFSRFTAPSAIAQQAAPAGPATRIDDAAAQRLMQDLRTLSSPQMEGRLTGTAGSRRAQAYIRERFAQIKVQPIEGSHEQKFSFTGAKPEVQQNFPDAVNLMGLIAGRERDRFVLVTAHYDHLGVRDGQTFHGADDNASGVAAMLAVASWFAGHQPAATLLFVAFDAEEQGLQGAKHFVAKPPIDLRRITAVVNLDMIGRGDKNVIFAAGTHHYPHLKAPVAEAAKWRKLSVRFGHDRSDVPGEKDWTHSSDHGPFHDAGVPFLYFGVEDHPDYHEPTDTSDKIPKAFYLEATELALDAVIRLANMPQPAVPRDDL
jgi:Zn-dependent M28 family amino/carboxypeptidase